MSTVYSLAGILSVITLLLCLGSPDPFLTLSAGAVLVTGLLLLWPVHGTPVLFLPFLLQWMSVSMKPLQSALTGAPLNDLATRGADLVPGAWFALGGILCLALGMWWTGGRHKRHFAREMQMGVAQLPRGFVLKATLLAIVAGHVLEAASGYAGPARSPVLMLSQVKLAGLFILSYWCLVRREAMLIFYAVITFETVFGMTGFLGEFRASLFILLISVLLARPRLNLRFLILGGAAAAFSLSAVVFWSAVKPEYRALQLSGDLQSNAARVAYLADQVLTMDGETYNHGLDAFASRLSYIDFLSHTLDYVPTYHPHTGGARTMEAVTHLLTPRIIFQNKPPVAHDTDITSRFTGLIFQGARVTSISIGYLGEFYVDFGKLGTPLAAFIFGAVIGRGYRFLMAYQGLPVIMNAAIATMAIIPFVYFERALIKLIGGGITLFIACLLIQRVGIPWVFRIISSRQEKARLRAASARRSSYRPQGSLRPRGPM